MYTKESDSCSVWLRTIPSACKQLPQASRGKRALCAKIRDLSQQIHRKNFCSNNFVWKEKRARKEGKKIVKNLQLQLRSYLDGVEQATNSKSVEHISTHSILRLHGFPCFPLRDVMTMTPRGFRLSQSKRSFCLSGGALSTIYDDVVESIRLHGESEKHSEALW